MRRSRWHRLRRAPDPHPSSGKTISTGASKSRAALGSRPPDPSSIDWRPWPMRPSGMCWCVVVVGSWGCGRGGAGSVAGWLAALAAMWRLEQLGPGTAAAVVAGLDQVDRDDGPRGDSRPVGERAVGITDDAQHEVG